MPTATSLLLFVAASVPLILVPGPAVAFVLATALRSGRRAGVSAALGVETGYLVHVLGAVVGVSAVIAASATAFTAYEPMSRPTTVLAWPSAMESPSGPTSTTSGHRGGFPGMRRSGESR